MTAKTSRTTVVGIEHSAVCIPDLVQTTVAMMNRFEDLKAKPCLVYHTLLAPVGNEPLAQYAHSIIEQVGFDASKCKQGSRRRRLPYPKTPNL